jgi:O-antigen ligase
MGLCSTRASLFAGNTGSDRAQLFRRHPLIGVGWGNFGNEYLAFRLPEASEEIKDPHNFIVRTFTELGAVGGVLLLAWLLLVWWELSGAGSAPSPDTTRSSGRRLTIRLLAMIALVGTVIGILAGVDLQQMAAYVFIECSSGCCTCACC